MSRTATQVKPGETWSPVFRQEASKTRDITGGLPRVADLFEARSPKDRAILADGFRHHQLRSGHQEQAAPDHHAGGTPTVPSRARRSSLIPKGNQITVYDGDLIQKGESIMDGKPNPQDLLRIQGVEPLAEYLVNEVQDVYRLQGVPINDKHIEVIVRQMLQKVEVLDAGETTQIRRATRSSSRSRIVENAKVETRGGNVWPPRRSRAAGHHQGVAGRPASSSPRPPSRRPPAC